MESTGFYQVPQFAEAACLMEWYNYLLNTQLQHQVYGTSLAASNKVVQMVFYALNQHLMFVSVPLIARIHGSRSQEAKKWRFPPTIMFSEPLRKFFFLFLWSKLHIITSFRGLNATAWQCRNRKTLDHSVLNRITSSNLISQGLGIHEEEESKILKELEVLEAVTVRNDTVEAHMETERL